MRQWVGAHPGAERRHGPGALAGSRELRPSRTGLVKKGALAHKAVFPEDRHTYASVPRRWLAYRTDRRQPSLPAGSAELALLWRSGMDASSSSVLSCGVEVLE